MPESRSLLIDGQAAQGSAEPLKVLNPTTGEVIAVVECAGEADIDRAVEVGARRFEEGVWSKRPIHERSRILNKFADLIEGALEDLYQLETLNNGRPIRETRAQIARLPEWYRYNAALLLADRASVVPMPGPYHSYTERSPLGVVGILSSFNHPLMITSKSLAPALATGNSVVLKPSELTPLTALVLGDLALEAGIPEGVLNVVPGLGTVAGARLAAHPQVAKITFTGGTAAGRAVARACAERFAKCTLELGGSSPVVVFPDSPLEEAVRGAAFSAFIGAGQTCIAGRRFIVHESVYKEFVDELCGVARSLRIGDPARLETQLGPMISHVARERIIEKVHAAEAEGVEVRHGGIAAHVDDSPGGFFIEPTVCSGPNQEFRLAREEIFGPVAFVAPFREESEAVSMANDSVYGLGAALWTRDVARAHRVASEIKSGIVWVNDHHRLDPSSPWGGAGESGIGREGGWESFHEFTHTKAITIRTAPEPVDWYGGQRLERLN
ncbi:MAG: aldehyde dehydrogenase [Actinomycetota bacterium]|nr:aldehyde dehydrogenase [Actinomycetota bacterium]